MSEFNLELWTLGVGSVLGAIALAHLRATSPVPAAADYSKVMFGRALVGIGFVLLLDALLNAVAVAGFAKTGTVPYLFLPGRSTNVVASVAPNNVVAPSGPVSKQDPSGGLQVVQTNVMPTNTPPMVSNRSSETARTNETPSSISKLTNPAVPEAGSGGKYLPADRRADTTLWESLTPVQKNLIVGIRMMLAVGFAIMGALFFFAKSLWEKMNAASPVTYDDRIFWAGLWFRLGETVVFTLVIFLSLLYKNYTEASGWMPLIALLLGLSVKAAENLIAGLIQRVLNAINGLIG